MNLLWKNSLMQQLMMRILMWQRIQLGMKLMGELMIHMTMHLMMLTMTCPSPVICCPHGRQPQSHGRSGT